MRDIEGITREPKDRLQSQIEMDLRTGSKSVGIQVRRNQNVAHARAAWTEGDKDCDSYNPKKARACQSWNAELSSKHTAMILKY